MPTAWGSLFLELLSQRGWSQRDFGKLVGMSQPNISKAIRGHPKVHGPPLERIDAWADTLELQGDLRLRFVRLAYLAHAPLQIRAMVDDFERQMAQIREELARRGIQLSEVVSNG